jgi:hypothetical protein
VLRGEEDGRYRVTSNNPELRKRFREECSKEQWERISGRARKRRQRTAQRRRQDGDGKALELLRRS